ncbi:SRPBCC family protein [Carboxylicivirga caseinilyticus]|uniref:SRPBCC family protein n=1 Tax=Carboxylicivirga caseinilyticus TaxID=3417572 RepID=UPI003D3254D3|nr:SRPBCC family protein [Marinilabiliaceae bacterium A049]
MAFYQFKRQQVIHTDLKTLWDFISSPANLSKITPEGMNFTITSAGIDKMYEGMIISYKVNLLPFIKSTWVTEITTIEDQHYFIDTQLIGPYKLWHHQHILEQTESGILMTDIVSYCPPLGLLGRIANTLFIKRQLKNIFDYREKKLNQIFIKPLP